MAQQPLNQTWDLDVFFPGGSSSPEFKRFLDELAEDVADFGRRLQAAGAPGTAAALDGWMPLLGTFQDLTQRIRQAGAFVSCLTAQDMADEGAKLLQGRVAQIRAALGNATTLLDHHLSAMPEEVFAALESRPECAAIAYPLRERRTRAAMRMDPQRESLAGDLAVDGYHAWGQLYGELVARVQIPWEEGGRTVHLSAGQAANKLLDPDRSVRVRLWERWEKAWADQADLIGAALNHLAGFRIQLYEHRGWDSILAEPLENNRMKAETLEVMWDVIDRNKGIFVEYLKRKARLLGLDKLAWHDVDAPLGGTDTKMTYDEAADFVVEHFGRFSPDMARFARKAFAERWIEAEDRPGKRPGGFCTSFPLSRQSRIFMTFGGNLDNVSTLAHELGHAYHQSVMNDLPQLAQGYAMNVAETASTFAELLVSDAALKAAGSDEERLALLASKAERAVAFFMNIHARFLFETRFYAEREKGLVPVARLNELMVQAQKEAYRDALSEYHPHFWASKLHFYSTGQPFYNFPYTFGFLFSSGVYARALEEGPAFAQRYVDLLRDTGRMRVEDLAAKHLGVDLTKPDFWQAAVDVSVADVRQFLALTEGR
ncbi:M3 family oligoendopeptidase [Symbiobacterium thermophilum]|uniref:Oligoendopeptidase n=1 Tax=Symbiobacterium thermophilum TaxID=2734 RepID=A0A953IBU3_SYMTR|nr:M3 family oligoendopeptidase [Symbiobacterium thermophilum]MBY6278208.1 oligoendopeptidase [Symbiobacterium thermophilum]